MRRLVLILAVLVISAVTVGYGATVAPTPPSDIWSPPPPGTIPKVTVSHANRILNLDAWGYCWNGLGCMDGFPPSDIPFLDILNGPVTVEFPMSGWEFDAGFVDISEDPVDTYGCGDLYLPAEVEQVGEHSWRFLPRGPAGPYRVDLYGTDPEGGDVSVSFLATTTADYPWPPSSARAMVEDGGRNATIRFIVFAWGLPATPQRASADIVLTGADGEHRISIDSAHTDECDVGAVDFRTSVRSAAMRNRLGDPPYDIRYEIVLDGVRHVATTGWPPYSDGQYYGLDYTPLEFEPPLPFGQPK